MQNYEYKVVPAPARGEKARGLKTTGDRFAHTLTGVMNDLAADGWDYLRADTLPCEERTGFRGRTTIFQNVLVFRRALNAAAAPQQLDTQVVEQLDRIATTLSARAPEGRAPRLQTPHIVAEAEANDEAKPKLGPASEGRASEGVAAE